MTGKLRAHFEHVQTGKKFNKKEGGLQNKRTDLGAEKFKVPYIRHNI